MKEKRDLGREKESKGDSEKDFYKKLAINQATTDSREEIGIQL